jgi:hypothetical protein
MSSYSEAVFWLMEQEKAIRPGIRNIINLIEVFMTLPP